MGRLATPRRQCRWSPARRRTSPVRRHVGPLRTGPRADAARPALADRRPMATTGQTPLVRSTDPLRHEHAELLPRIEDLRATADAADVLDRGALVAELDAALGFLRGHLVPHARAEDAALYPAVERALGAPGATATMSRDHVEVVRL